MSKDFYDHKWANRSPALNFYEKHRADEIIGLIRKYGLKTDRILDLGCGNGWLSGMLARFGRVTGVDFSETAIEKARKNFPDCEFIAGDILEYSAKNKYDLLVCSEVIEHLKPEGQKQLVRVMNDNLEHGGHIINTSPNRALKERILPLIKKPQPIENWLSADELKTLLSSHFLIKECLSIVHWDESARRFGPVNKLRSLICDRPRLKNLVESSLKAFGKEGLYLLFLCSKKYE
ncbi:MAG: methyltransferase domain-containing protein [Candidatus Margulisiibacteriota bacterium]